MQLSFCAIRRIIAAFLIVCWFFLGIEGFKNKCIKEKFENEEHQGRIILCWAKWCGHCKAIKRKEDSEPLKEWDLFKKEHDGVIDTSMGKVSIQDYEVDESPQIVKSLGVKGFPTILLISKNGDKIPYKGPRTQQGWKKFVLQNANDI